MWKNPLIPLVWLLILLLPQVPTATASNDWWNTSWSYRQEITLPIDLHSPAAPGQPIDLRLTLTNPCWTQDATHTSLRVISEVNGDTTELEYELYNLTFASSEHLASCSLIFILPPDLTGDEHLYAYYDDNPTPPTQYPDHVTITTSSYYLEPIPGYAIQSQYYLITDDHQPIYAISYAGQFLYYTTTHYITKLTPNATTVLPTTTDMLASFEFKYYYANGQDQFQTTADHALTYTILRDGTLSTTIQITSTSKDATLHTTATYTYYHTTTPTHTRIRIHTDHTTTAECHVTPGASTDGTLASLQCGGIHTSTLPELNINRLYPYAHLHTTTGTDEYRIDPTPDYTTDPVTRLLAPTDNVDLTTPAWASFDQGTNGTAHALLFATTHVLQTGTDETDGIQPNLYESNTPNLPGFRNDAAILQCNRNSVTTTNTQDLAIPANYHATYDAEFYTTTSGGYPSVQNEATLYPQLIILLPGTTNGTHTPTKPEPRYTLTIHALDAPSTPLGAPLSILLGKNYSFITAAVYQHQTLISTGTTTRLTIHQATTDTNKSSIIDWKNLSLTKTIHFPNLPPGDYLIKIYRQHPHHTNQTQCIGYTTITLTDNTTVRIRCGKPTTVTYQIHDQHGQGILDAQINIGPPSAPIAWATTNQHGAATLALPRQRTPYETSVIYKGFLLAHKSLRTPLLTRKTPAQTITTNLSTLTITILDTWQLPPEITLAPQLTSTWMYQPENLSLTATNPGHFTIAQIPQAPYTCRVRYQSFTANTTIPLQETSATIVFPAEYPIRFRFLDARGTPIQGVSFTLKRGQRTLPVNATDNLANVSLPPGLYQLDAQAASEEIASRPLQINGPKEVTIVARQDSTGLGFIIGGIAILGITGVLSYKKKDWIFFIPGLIIALIVFSLWLPWWQISGTSAETHVSSQFFLFPTSLVSIIQTPQVLSGELATLPSQFSLVMSLFLLGCILGASLLLLSLVLLIKKRRRLMWASWLGSLLIFGGSLLLVLVSISLISTISVGGLMGRGPFQVTIPGEGIVELPASWGPGLGLFCFLAALVLAGILMFFIFKRKRKTG